MAKKIDRSRIEAGRFELPKKLAFLVESKVDYTSISEAEDGWRVELPASALAALAKLKTSLKALKADGKQIAAGHANALGTATAAHEETLKELAAAQRKIKALEKKLLAASPALASPAPVASAPAAPVKTVKAEKAVKTVKAAKPAVTAAKPVKPQKPAKTAKAVTAPAAPAAVDAVVPVPGPKLPKKLAVKKASVVAQPAPLATAGAILPGAVATADVATTLAN